MNKKALLAILLVIIILTAMVATQGFGIEALKLKQHELTLWYKQSPIVACSLFFLLYIVVTAFSLPFATVLTLAAAAIMGFIPSLILVSFASTIGATMAFLISRYFLRDSYRNRFGERLKIFESGMEKDGAYYLFSLRLLPVFPFFLINTLMGLTPIHWWTYFWVSQLGMLPGTLIYINAGVQLSSINQIQDIMSWKIMLSFSLIGVFPIIIKKFLKR
jgi:uncharacterized membrane protein YdjX (TVP38/TMEM64 family)